MSEIHERYPGEERELREAVTNARNVIGELLGMNSETYQKLEAALKSEGIADLRAAVVIVERAEKLFDVYPEYADANPEQLAELKAVIRAITRRKT